METLAEGGKPPYIFMTAKTCNKNERAVGSTPEERFWSRVAVTADIERCWNWQGGVDRDGYGRVYVNGKRTGSHRVAWFYVKGVWPTAHILHSCDNPSCVNPNHLREGTDQDNRNDAVSRGRQARGETNGNVKLTEAQVIEIRERYADGGITYQSLGEMFGVRVASISRIVKRKYWRHIGHGTSGIKETI